MEFSLPHILILLLIIVILFGGRKIPEVMRGLGSGIREFREGMKGNDQPPTNPPASTRTTDSHKRSSADARTEVLKPIARPGLGCYLPDALIPKRVSILHAAGDSASTSRPIASSSSYSRATGKPITLKYEPPMRRTNLPPQSLNRIRPGFVARLAARDVVLNLSRRHRAQIQRASLPRESASRRPAVAKAPCRYALRAIARSNA